MGPAFGRGSDSVHPSERPQPQLRSRPQYHLRSRPQYHLRSLRQYLRSLRDFVDTRLGWDPGPRHQYHSAELGGPDPLSGPVHQARVSHPHPGLRHHQSHRLQRRHLRSICHLPPGLGGLCTSGTPFRGILHCIRGTFIRSHSTTSQRCGLIPDSGIR